MDTANTKREYESSTTPESAFLAPTSSQAREESSIQPAKPTAPEQRTAPATQERSSQPLLLSQSELAELVERDGSEEWVIEEFAQRGSLVIVVGDSGLGKSPLLYQMGLALASGKPFLGRKTRQGRVIYMDLENGANPSAKLASKLANYMGLDSVPEGFLRYMPGFCAAPDVERIVAETRPSLLIIDSFRMHNPDAADNKNNAATTELKQLRAIARNFGCAVLLIHHIKKPGETGTPALENENVSSQLWLNEASGARALINHTDIRIGVDRVRLNSKADGPEDIALVIKGFTRIEGEFGPLYVGRDYGEDGKPIGYRLCTGMDLLKDDYKKCLFSLPTEFTFSDAKAALKKSDQPTANFLKKCQSCGVVERTSRGYRKTIGDSDGSAGVMAQAA